MSLPASAAPASAPFATALSALSGIEKAAIVVRYLLSEGTALPLRDLPDDHQIALTQQIARMRMVDRATLAAVVEEFAMQIESIGLSFPAGIEGALKVVDGHLSDRSLTRLRKTAGLNGTADPWASIAATDPDQLAPVLADESIEVCAVLLSKLPVPRAAALLGRVSGDRARRIAYAVSQTGRIAPETVARIGQSLADQLQLRPVSAFDKDPVDRIGAILNSATAAIRDDLLNALQETDRGFAEQVRRKIFTFADIPARIAPRDIARVARAVDQPVLVTALAGAGPRQAAAAEFILANMSQRLAGTLRDEMAALDSIRDADAEAAMGRVVAAIRDLEEAGEIALIAEEEPA